MAKLAYTYFTLPRFEGTLKPKRARGNPKEPKEERKPKATPKCEALGREEKRDQTSERKKERRRRQHQFIHATTHDAGPISSLLLPSKGRQPPPPPPPQPQGSGLPFTTSGLFLHTILILPLLQSIHSNLQLRSRQDLVRGLALPSAFLI